MRVGLMKKQYSGSLTLTFIPTLKIRRLPKKKSTGWLQPNMLIYKSSLTNRKVVPPF